MPRPQRGDRDDIDNVRANRNGARIQTESRSCPSTDFRVRQQHRTATCNQSGGENHHYFPKNSTQSLRFSATDICRCTQSTSRGALRTIAAPPTSSR